MEHTCTQYTHAHAQAHTYTFTHELYTPYIYRPIVSRHYCCQDVTRHDIHAPRMTTGTQQKASSPTALSQRMGAHEALAGTLEILGAILDKDLRVGMAGFRFPRAVCGDNLLALLFLPELEYPLVLPRVFLFPFLGLKCSSGVKSKA